MRYAPLLNEEREPFILFPLGSAIKHVEKRAIREALLITQGNKRQTAFLLEIDYKTLLKKAKE